MTTCEAHKEITDAIIRNCCSGIGRTTATLFLAAGAFAVALLAILARQHNAAGSSVNPLVGLAVLLVALAVFYTYQVSRKEKSIERYAARFSWYLVAKSQQPGVVIKAENIEKDFTASLKALWADEPIQKKPPVGLSKETLLRILLVLREIECSKALPLPNPNWVSNLPF